MWCSNGGRDTKRQSLVVTASDSCGNEATRAISFTIDNELPVITVDGIEDGACSNETVTLIFGATVDPLVEGSATLNDEPYTSGTPITDEGAYTLVVTATEECGRETSETWTFLVDLTEPEITVSGVEDGQAYTGSVVAEWFATDANAFTVEALLDGAPVTPPLTVDVLGRHVLEVSAVDCAENHAVVTVAFTIEAQGPPPLVGDLTVSPEPVETGQPVTLSAVVSNGGMDLVENALVLLVVRPEGGGDPVAQLASTISLGPEETRTVVEILETGRIMPGLYRVELQVSGTFFGADYELELDQAGLEVLRMAAIPGLTRAGSLLLSLLIAGFGLWVLRRTR